MRTTAPTTTFRSAGFTLIEILVTVAIVGILAAIALPSYSEYVTRGKLMEAHSKLADLRAQQERYFMDNRTYISTGTTCGIDDAAILMTTTYNADAERTFDVSCAATATTYTVTATGRPAKGMSSSFVLTVNQANAKTSAGPAGWTSANCWFVRKSGECS